MSRRNIRDEYFEWLCDFIGSSNEYSRLLKELHATVFEYDERKYPMDVNRIFDGRDLKYRFGSEMNYSDRIITYSLEQDDVSLLEVMIALAIRIENDMMMNLDYGDRTGQWVWGMINSLGLGKMTDARFNQRKFDTVITKFFNHDYERDGHGSLFVIEDCEYDMREEEIWTQMNWYLGTLEE